jgi:Cof subfamily protein (haloacid dehalogenase superfamily)
MRAARTVAAITPRLLACDLDGTLLDSLGRLTDTTATALRLAHDAGLALAVLTARPRRDVPPSVSGRMPAATYWAYSNGAVVHDPAGDPPYLSGFAPEQTLRLVARLRSAHPSWSCALDLADRTLTVDPFPHRAAARWSDVVRLRTTAGIRLPETVPKILVHTATHCDAAVVAEVQRVAGHEASATASGPDFVELMPPGVGKPQALTWICTRLGITPGAAVAVGDGLNDLAMLRLAGLGATPANAPLEVHRAADLVLPSNDEDAVAVLIGLLLDRHPAPPPSPARQTR